jgi:tetratricopeptide (TPR) repeat protein
MSLEHPESEGEPDDSAELIRLLKEFQGEEHLENCDSQAMSLLMESVQWAEKQEPTPRDAALEAFFAANNRQDWQAAAAACRQLISLSDKPTFTYQGWRLLAGTLYEQERHDEALAAARTATDAARATEMEPLIIPALQEEIGYAVRAEEFEHAQHCLREGLALTADPDPMLAWMRAGFLIARAEAFLRAGDTDAASADLSEAEPMLQKYAASMMMAGPLSALGRWWNAAAELRLHTGDVEGARKASQEALWIARRLSEMLQMSEGNRRGIMRRGLETFAKIQEKSGDAAAAGTARQEAADLRAAYAVP